MTTQPGPFDPNIPERFGDPLATSQPELQNNFFQMYNIFKRNHIEINDSIAPGIHKFIEILQQDNAPQTDIGEISVYTKDVEGQTDQLFLKFQGGQEIQLTNYQIYSIKSTQNQTYNFTTLPGKVIVYFGHKIANDNPGNITLLPPVAKNVISACVIPEFNNPGKVGKYPSKPDLSIIKNTDGIITKIGVLYPTILGTPNSYYFIMANI